MIAIAVVEQYTISQSSSGSITGKIYIRTEGYYFPEKDWNDFVVAILELWIDAILRLLRRASCKEELRFMDGPLWIEITDSAEGTWQMKFVDGGGRVNVSSLVVERDPFVRSVLSAASDVVEECKRNRWNSRNVETLIAACNQLRAFIANSGKTGEKALQSMISVEVLPVQD